jgi:hypothetical protein
VLEYVVEAHEVEPFLGPIEGLREVAHDDFVVALTRRRHLSLRRDRFDAHDARVWPERVAQVWTEAALRASDVEHRATPGGNEWLNVLTLSLPVNVLLGQ